MKKQTTIALLTFGFTLFCASAQAAVKTYQVTGPILDLTPTTVTVQKGTEKWTLQRDAATETKGELKVGDKLNLS